MARGRMISASIAEDIEFNAMSMEAKMLFMMAIPHLDRDGLISGHSSLLQGKICPLLPEMLPRMQEIVAEWAAAGMVLPYMSGKAPALFFTGFTKNQGGMRYEREAPSLFNPPPGYRRTPAGLVLIQPASDIPHSPNGSAPSSMPDELRMNSGVSPAEVKDQDQVKDQLKGEDLVGYSAAQPAQSQPVAAPPPTAYPIDLDLPEPPTEAQMQERIETSVSVTRAVKYKLNDYEKYLAGPHMKGAKVVAGYVEPGTGRNAVQVFHERHSADDAALRLTAPQQDDLVRAATDMEKWREIVIACDRKNYRPKNFDVRLEWYRKGIPDATRSASVDSPDRREFGILSKGLPNGQPANSSSVTVSPDEAAEIRKWMQRVANERAAATLAEQQQRLIRPA